MFNEMTSMQDPYAHSFNEFSPTSAVNRPTKRILVIEDDQVLEVTLKRILKAISPEIAVDWAESLEEAEQLLKRSRWNWLGYRSYDLVLSDIYLPNVRTGFEFYDTYQKSHPGSPFAFVSSMSIQDYLQHFDHQSCPPFISKPFTPRECKKVVASLLKIDPVLN